jgi:hypothetical protein
MARCPRCGHGFHCGAAGVRPCAYAAVALPQALTDALRERFDGCLCVPCLQALARGAPLLVPAGDPAARAPQRHDGPAT